MCPKSEDEFFSNIVVRWSQSKDRPAITSVMFPSLVYKHVSDNAVAYVSQHGGDIVEGFLIAQDEEPFSFLVRPHILVRDGKESLLDPTLTQGQLQDQSFLKHEGTEEEFQAISKSTAQKKVKLTPVQDDRLSIGQVRFMVNGFIGIVLFIACIFMKHTDGYVDVADYLGYALPCAAAIVVGGKLYIGERATERGLYEFSIFLLFVGMLCNAYSHPCGSPVIVAMCLPAALICLCVLAHRIYIWYSSGVKTESAIRSLASGLSVPSLVAILIVAIAYTFVFWHDLFLTVGGIERCFPRPAG